MTTIGELFDVAIARLQEVAQTPLASVAADERAALAHEVGGCVVGRCRVEAGRARLTSG
ncbi:hypothetical protein OHS33_34730 [Streptomyces sp. NBC_00536]|uniref:hypothetical protein n=1 Tax=Streptomyces sp. NBC_00536 TaxID=2975769 RepID=UPI002E7FB7B1|nr:hypothetical protein [Streptomyces sp. NBC_00536]WUC83074.1 hypothetical protein OHS33_34730 [Streptomyces sp. NBC_00536]